MENEIYELKPIPREVKVNKDDEIYLSVTIGNAQIGTNTVSYKNQTLVKGDLKDSAYLGEVKDLNGDTIKVITKVLDANPSTDNCVITTKFLNQNDDVLFSKKDRGVAPTNGIAFFIGLYKLKILSLIIMCFLLLPGIAFGQEEKSTIDFEDILIPISPGFILLEETPAVIERPSTPQALGLSLLGIEDESFAVEFAPYWLTDKPDLTALDYYSGKKPIFSNFSISLASVNSDTSSYVSIGFRTRLLEVYSKETRNKLSTMISEIQDTLNLIKSCHPIYDPCSKADSTQNIRASKNLKTQKNEFDDTIEKPILSIDIASALAGGTDTRVTEDITLSRWAAWANLNWRPNADNFYLTILSKYTRNVEFEGYDPDTDLADLGTRFNYDFVPFTVSLEYIQRLNLTEDIYDDYRLAIVGNYKISDSLYLTTTFGKNFTDVDNIIALAGINFGLSKRKITASDTDN